jgi:hypothetical protein
MSIFSWLEKNPLEAAALGAGIVGTGGTAAGALGGFGAAPAMGATNAALIDSAVGTAGYGASSATPMGLMGGMSQFADKVKPYGQAAQAAMSVKGLLDSPSQPVQGHAPPGMDGQGAQTLAQLAQQSGQMTPEMQARLQRKTMWG